MPNLVYLVLRETIPYLPADLTQEELADRLLDFVIGSQGWLNWVIHDRRFIEDPGRLAEVTKEFVLQVLASDMDKHQVNEIQAAKVRQAKTYRFSYPEGDEDDFPYRDDEKAYRGFYPLENKSGWPAGGGISSLARSGWAS